MMRSIYANLVGKVGRADRNLALGYEITAKPELRCTDGIPDIVQDLRWNGGSYLWEVTTFSGDVVLIDESLIRKSYLPGNSVRLNYINEVRQDLNKWLEENWESYR